MLLLCRWVNSYLQKEKTSFEVKNFTTDFCTFVFPICYTNVYVFWLMMHDPFSHQSVHVGDCNAFVHLVFGLMQVNKPIQDILSADRYTKAKFVLESAERLRWPPFLVSGIQLSCSDK